MKEFRFRASVIAVAVLLSAAMASDASAQEAHYMSRQQTGLARAFCPGSMPVLGGGGFVETHPPGAFQEKSLRQTHPISDRTGVIAFGSTAIGWQVASSDFSGRVAAFAACADRRLADAISVQYVSGQAIGVAMAFCPAGTKVIGGGGFVEALEGGGLTPVKLRKTHPISDETGVIAFESNAIGWQAASSDFTETVVAFAVCAAPTPGATLDVEYVSVEDTGVARAVCPVNTTVTGGGGFVETTPFAPVALRQTYPISDEKGAIARGRNAIGWQAASSNFQDTVLSFAICTTASR
jgi:hypothetical protein